MSELGFQQKLAILEAKFADQERRLNELCSYVGYVAPSRAPRSVAFYTHSLGLGGAERWILMLCRHLDPQRVTVRAIVTDDVSGAMAREACRYAPLVRPADWDLDADILIGWGGELPHPLKKFTGTTVAVAHGDADHPWQKNVSEKLLRGYTYHVGVSAGSAASLGSRTVIHNGAELDRVTPRRRIAKPSKKVALFVGRFSPEKRPELLPAIARALPSEWAVLGVGPDCGKEVASQGRFVRCGATDHPGDYYAIADAVILPSETEAFPLVMCESWLAGVPFVGVRWPIVTELEAKHERRLGEFLGVDDGPAAWAADILRSVNLPSEEIRQLAWREFSATAAATRWADYLETLPA